MNWQVNYALQNIWKNYGSSSAQYFRDDAISVVMSNRPHAVAVISADFFVNIELVKKYHDAFPNMEFLCGFRKECVWDGMAIKYLEANMIGWGSAGTLGSAISKQELRTATHKEYFFSYRLIKQMRSIASLDREYDRVFTMTLVDGRVYRVGMILEYEPTADAIRTFWDRFGPINIAWHINPNGYPTSNAIEAGRSLGCEVMGWDELKSILRKR